MLFLFIGAFLCSLISWGLHCLRGCLSCLAYRSKAFKVPRKNNDLTSHNKSEFLRKVLKMNTIPPKLSTSLTSTYNLKPSLSPACMCSCITLTWQSASQQITGTRLATGRARPRPGPTLLLGPTPLPQKWLMTKMLFVFDVRNLKCVSIVTILRSASVRREGISLEITTKPALCRKQI